MCRVYMRDRERESKREKYYNYILLIQEYFNSQFWVGVSVNNVYIYIYGDMVSAGNYHMKLRGWDCRCIYTLYIHLDLVAA
jgi:hypothetical protein